MKPKILILSVFAASAALIVAFGSITAARALAPAEIQSPAQTDLGLHEYVVPGNPSFLTVDPAERIWFTLPGQNSIGRLVVQQGNVLIDTYAIPTANAEPYRITFAAGAVWFTERTGNAIGRLDPQTGDIVEFPIPTAGAHPAGIDVLAGIPTTVWFTEALPGPSANGLARLVVTSTIDFAFAEFPLPKRNDVYVDLQAEDVRIENGDAIWFTAPADNKLYQFTPSKWPSADSYASAIPCPTFAGCTTNNLPHPLALDLVPGGGQLPGTYTTDPTGNRILRLDLSTLQSAVAYPVPTLDAGLNDLLIDGTSIWFSERNAGRLGLLHLVRPDPMGPLVAATTEFSLSAGSAPQGLALDQSGCAWTAESGSSRIARLCLYSHQLPFLTRGNP